MKKTEEKGITLIALVVTIVVLLILAGISISMLTGDNGVITQSKNAKEATEQAKVEELVSVAIGSVISKNNGSTAGITPKMVADQINEDEKRTDVYAENETTFPTNIIFPKENRKAEVNLNTGKFVADENSIYSADVNEADIAPMDLFDYEIINNGETGALTLDNLPTKTVKITRIKPEYCNKGGYNGNQDTNYEIIYNGNKISETLVVPYQVDGKYVPNGLEGEYYKVTEVSLAVINYGKKYEGLPKIKNIIYPNTITKITGETFTNDIVEEVILPVNIQNIEEYAFRGCTNLKNIIIPESVTSIGNYAFYECSSLTSINIPESVISIGYHAFEDCSSLTNITIPNSVTSIGISVFRQCSSLTSITIPESVTSIGYYAFDECRSLTSITIPESVISIENEAFSGCSSLTIINVSVGNNKYDSRNNCNAIIETETNELVVGCKTTVIPESVTSIGEYAFYGCSSLTSITIPDSVTSIGNYAFEYCGSLTSITIPDSVTNIGEGAFWQCSSLISITIPESVTSIGYYAFEYCSSLTSITIPESVTSIEDHTFYGCSSLTSITIPDSVTSIGNYAFEKCDNLTTVNYKETEEKWNKISISSYGNDYLKNATINYNYTN